MKHILYIETGTTGGGSFASMLLNLAYINRDLYTPIAVFLNETSHKREAEALGVTTYLLSHPFYSRQVCYRRRLYRFILRVTARHLPALYMPIYSIVHRRLIAAMKRIVARHHIDVVHLNNNAARDLFGVLVSKKTGTACISHLRSGPPEENHIRRLTKLTNDLVFAYIAISGYVKQQWAIHGIDVKKCHVIHNGIPPLHVQALDVRKRFKLGNVETVICGVGRLVEWKNHSFLIRAFSEHRKTYPSSALVLVGDGPERANLEKLARALDVESHVVLTGYCEEAHGILAGSDIFVLPSKEEPFGRVTLEAMALKVPVIATRSGGSLELVCDKRTGLLVSLNDIPGLCKALQALSECEALRRRLVVNAYESTQSSFHIRNCVAAIEDLYAAT